MLAHIVETFLSPNEDDQAKLSIEKITQGNDSLPMHNRKYREKAIHAYPHPRSQDAERILIRSYTRSLNSNELAKALTVEGHPQTLDQAMLFAEHRSAGLELFKSIGRQEEPMEIGATNAVPDPVVTALDGLTSASYFPQSGMPYDKIG